MNLDGVIKNFKSFIVRLKRHGLIEHFPYKGSKDVEAMKIARLFRVVLDKTLFYCWSSDWRERKESRAYFNRGNKDFLEVCKLAHVEPRDVLLLYKTLTKEFKNDKYDIKKRPNS